MHFLWAYGISASSLEAPQSTQHGPLAMLTAQGAGRVLHGLLGNMTLPGVSNTVLAAVCLLPLN